MLALRSFVAVFALAVLSQQALATNDPGGYGAADGVQEGSPPAASVTPARRSRDAVKGANGPICSKPQATSEQRADRNARKQQQTAQGVHRVSKTPEQKAQAAARRTANCGTAQPL